jgi:hypothetical protein
VRLSVMRKGISITVHCGGSGSAGHDHSQSQQRAEARLACADHCSDR